MAGSDAAVDVHDTFGMLVIGTILGSIFYGITLLQTGIFLGKRSQERIRTSVLVIVLCIMDTMTWFLEMYTTWFYFVVNYDNPAALAEPYWALKLEPGFTYTVAFIAQLFFIEKIYLLTNRSMIVGITMVVLAFTAWALGLTMTGIVFKINSITSITINNVNIAQKTLSTLIEVVIAGIMCYMFKTRQTGMHRTDSMLYRLIVFAASRGLIMSIVQVLYTIVFFVYNDKLYWVVFHFMLGKLCSNSVLASLNIRDIMRGNDSSNYSGSNSIALSAPRSGVGFRKPGPMHAVLPRDTRTIDDQFTSYNVEFKAQDMQPVDLGSEASGIKVETTVYQHSA